MKHNPLQIHKKYGLVNISGIEIIRLEPGTSHKYKITVKYLGQTHAMQFGDPHYEQYRDRTPAPIWSHLNHGDNVRRNSYLTRASKIRDGIGRLTCNDPFSPNRWAIIYLW